MTDWISVEDRLPGKNQWVKVKNDCLEVKAQFLAWEEGAIGYYFCCDISGIDSDVKWTHWMPLPAPPITENENKKL